MKTLLVLACLIAYVSAHACLVSPQQRGGYPNNALNTKGASACGKTKDSPCGGAKMEHPMTTYMGGMKYNITFQKNLDHYYKDSPGSWSLNLWKGDKSTNLLKIADPSPDKVGTLDFVTVPVSFPKKVSRDDSGYILQLIYETNNPDVDKLIFYQCADIMIA